VPSEPTPTSTYRLQLGPDLTFADAGRLADYLADLGISHAYLSPILVATPGSTHGYDVVDHREINPELGGAEGFAAMAAAFRDRDIGIIVDVVPNHMAVPTPESPNRALWSVLLEGEKSPFAGWFDIDWSRHGGRILMPVLDGTLEDNLPNLEIVTADDGSAVLAYFEHRLPIDPTTGAMGLADLVEAQHYLLADWRTASSELNYRRFVDITTLIALQVQDPEVFEDSHRVLIDLVANGAVQGLRIDHPDGLAQPAKYLADLAAATNSTWVVVEKILARDEPLPADWKSAGTTGYEALTELNGLFVDPASETELGELYADISGEPADFAAVADAGKRLIAIQALATELDRMTRLLGANNIGAGEPGLRAAIVEVVVGLDVYRPFAASPRTIAALDEATAHAQDRRPELSVQIDAVRLMAGTTTEFATRFGQYAAAVYAKGVEDTAFYRHARLLALNEVGGNPGRFGVSTAEFHAFATELQSTTPTAMTTLSTHDTKRGEDARARLAVLSELPAEWAASVRRWLARAAELGCPDPRAGYFFFQTWVGAFPLTVERATRYMEKATREAKLQTSWAAPDAGYDAAIKGFVTAALGDADLVADIAAFVDATAAFAWSNSLSQKLIQLVMPGVPDTYQGTELPNYALVDPDNRGPVDFGARRRALADPLDDKVRLTTIALRLRRSHPHWFSTYTPLAASGVAADHAVVFGRSDHVVVAATRLPAGLQRDGGWRDTVVTLPAAAWLDALSGLEHDLRYSAGDILASDLFAHAPVALLVPGVTIEDAE
jgi:(1->4)-alpha-D-glucan 1-alpha-D-glucosylmutase